MLKEVKSEENGERRSIATCLADICTLTDTTTYINLRDKFLSKIKEISEDEIGKVVVRTRKLPSELVDSKFLDLINIVVGEYAKAHIPGSIRKLRISCKLCRYAMTRQHVKRSLDPLKCKT
ncbi:hypothetical protein LUQ84_002101 [Hamiltosporidium tvaerminnensis]|nr:hypothetical protein LUQ84_002101 [Hamiltosporidium tvaerminnensis]